MWLHEIMKDSSFLALYTPAYKLLLFTGTVAHDTCDKTFSHIVLALDWLMQKKFLLVEISFISRNPDI